MTPEAPTVRVLLPENSGDDDVAVVRVYSPDLELVAEGTAGATLKVNPGVGYTANAVSMTGQTVGLPTRFDLKDGVLTLDVQLDARSPVRMSAAATAADQVHLITSSPRPGSPSYELATMALRSGARTTDGRPELAITRSGMSYEQAVGQVGGAQPPLPHGQVWCVEFPGPGRVTRYATVPYDVQPWGAVSPQLRWSDARTTGYFLPSFKFQNPVVNALQSALRHTQSSLARPIAQKALADMAQDALADKTRSPLGAALAGLILLQDDPERLQRVEPWTANLLNWFPWLPDALPLRVEVLARMGRHREARDLLRQLPTRGPPWTRKGLRVLVERMSYYDASESAAENRDMTQWYQALLAMTHPACVFCVFESPRATAISPILTQNIAHGLANFDNSEA